MLVSIHSIHNIKITNIILAFHQMHPYEKREDEKRQKWWYLKTQFYINASPLQHSKFRFILPSDKISIVQKKKKKKELII